MNCRRALWRRHAQSLPACGLAACLALAAALAACGRGEDPNAMAAPLKVLQTHESEGARLDLSLERESLTTAGSVLLRLEVECAESDTVDFPGPDDSFGEFAVVRDEELSGRLVGNRRVVRGHDYVLQPFLPGEYEVPALTVALNGSAEIATEPFAIAVASVLEDPESADLLEIADAIDMPAPWWWWVSLALGAAAILGGAAWWWKRRKEQRLAPLPVPVHEAALAALDALLAEDLPAAETPEAVLHAAVRCRAPLYRGTLRVSRPGADDRGVPHGDGRYGADPQGPPAAAAQVPAASRHGQVCRIPAR